MKYRKKVASIEAFQYDGDFMNSNGEYYVPQWAVMELKDENGVLYYDGPSLMFRTFLDDMKVDVGDYIIQDENGSVFPCNKKCFNKIYERVE